MPRPAPGLAQHKIASQPRVCVADKQSAPKTDQNVAKFNKTLLGWFEEVPPFFITSAEKGQGRDKLLQFVQEVNEDFVKPEIDPQFYSASNTE